jgi:hypothetical protein
MPLENTASKVSSDIYFIIYISYYVSQINKLGQHVRLIKQCGVSIVFRLLVRPYKDYIRIIYNIAPNCL